MAALGIDALLVTHLPNVHYLTGMRASAAAALIDGARVALITDARYTTAARTLADTGGAGIDLAVVEARGSYDQCILEAVRGRGLARVGLEAEHISLARWRRLRDSLGDEAALVPTEGLVEAERMVKDAAEIGCLRRAGRLLAGVVPAALRMAGAGSTEREVAADIEHALAAAGFEDRAFETIVASGPRSALPHARPGRRRLAAGDLVVLDFGGVYDGYCVDLTRTASVGEPGGEALRMHAAVLAAETVAIAAVRPARRPAPSMRRPAGCSASTVWLKRSSTEPATGWVSKCTRRRASRRQHGCRVPARTSCSRPAWSLRSNPGCTSPARAVCASRTMSW